MATKTIDHMDLYVSIAPYKHENAPDQTFNCLRVYVSYRKGRGFIVGYHPGWGDGSMWGCMLDIGDQNPLTGGQEVLAKAATKNSVKELQAMYDSLNQGTARKIIAMLFDHRKWPILLESLRHIALSSTWATEELLASLTRQLTNNENESDNEPKSEETMANEKKGADLIGKTVRVKDAESKYVIKSVDGDNIVVDFYRTADAKPVTIPTLKLAMLENMVKAGTWVIEGDATDPNGEPDPDAVGEIVDVEEVDDIKVEGPKATAETIDMKPKKKSEKPKAKTSEAKCGRYTFKTYTREKNGHKKTLGRIDGLQEGDELLEREVAEKLHASPMYDRNEDGTKTWWLSFGKRYVDAGRKVCEAMNAGKTIGEMQAIVDAQTDENHRLAEERRAKREANAEEPKGKTYTEAEVADLLKRVIAGDKEAMEIVNAMSKAA